MNLIAMLPGTNMRRQIFRDEHLEQLSQWGTVRLNERDENPDKAQVMEMIRGARIAITSWGCPPIDRDVLNCAPELQLIVHAAGTVKGIVTPDVIERGIRVSSANDALGVGVAETALGLTIASLKNIWELASNTRQGKWNEGKSRVRELYEVTIGVVGAGKAGRHFIRLLRNFDVRIVVYDPYLDEQEAIGLGAERVELERLLRESDVVSIHAPSIPSTYRMFNRETFALMKDDAVLINTARGSLIDEDDLVNELRKGRFIACIDVTDPEPPRPDHPFRELPNCILIPHIAGAVNNGKYRIGKYVVEEVRRFVTGQPMDGEVNLGKLHIIA